MRPDAIKEYLRASLVNPKQYPPMFMWGGPGIGKSAVSSQVIDEVNVELDKANPGLVGEDDWYNFIDIRMLLYDPTDLRGIIMPKHGKAVWFSPEFLPRSGKGIIVFDELNCAPPMVQNSGLQLFLDRKLGTYTLPDGYVCVAAGNYEGQGFVNKMAPALKNRFMHQDFEVVLDCWSEWAFKHNIHPSIIGFLNQFRPELINQFDATKNAFPTPRTWEFTSNHISNGHGVEMIDQLVKGTIGEGAAIEFKTYRQIWTKLPSFDEIFAGKDIIPDGVDMIYALITGLVAKADTKANYNRLLEYSMKLDSEFKVFMAKLLFQKDRSKTTASPNWADFSRIIVEDGIAT